MTQLSLRTSRGPYGARALRWFGSQEETTRCRRHILVADDRARVDAGKQAVASSEVSRRGQSRSSSVLRRRSLSVRAMSSTNLPASSSRSSTRRQRTSCSSGTSSSRRARRPRSSSRLTLRRRGSAFGLVLGEQAEERANDLPGFTLPTWDEVQRAADEYEPRRHDRLVIDGICPLDETVSQPSTTSHSSPGSRSASGRP